MVLARGEAHPTMEINFESALEEALAEAQKLRRESQRNSRIFLYILVFCREIKKKQGAIQ